MHTLPASFWHSPTLVAIDLLLLGMTISLCPLILRVAQRRAQHIIEVTERKLRTQEEALHICEAKTEALFNQVCQLICLLNRQGDVVDANASALRFAGIEANAVVGKPYWDTPWWSHSPDLQHRLKEAVAQAAAGTFARFETTHRTPTGELRTVDFSLKPVTDVRGRVVWLIAEGHDITERKLTEQVIREAKEAAEAASIAKSEFLANMSHEIRTPMTSILGFTDIILENVDNPETIDAARTVKNNGQYLLSLINDILDLSKVEAGKVELERISCCPRQLVTDVHQLMDVRARAKGLPLDFRFEGPIPTTIQTDTTRLRQVLINIVWNAIKFTETGSVQLVARLVNEAGHPPRMQFNVIDSGIGIPPDKVHKLFQPFSQVDCSTTRKFGGTGLGLAISQRLTEALGGRIQVASTPGEGTTFSITVLAGSLDGVPLLENCNTCPERKECQSIETLEETRTVVNPEDETSSAPLSGVRVLLAEDGPDNQRLISFLLKKAGAEVAIAENGRVGRDMTLDAWRHGDAFDVVLIDMQMPVMDGYTATTELRTAGYRRPIIALTAHAMSTDRDKCVAAGCDDYMTKPVDRGQLISLVEEYAGGHPVDVA